MDGHNTNWEILKLLHSHWSSKGCSSLICNIGSCGLRIVHGALKTGMKSQDRKIDQVFRSMLGLLHRSPARQDTYIRVGETDLFRISKAIYQLIHIHAVP